MIGFLILFIGAVLLGWLVLYKLSTAMRFVVFKEEEEPKMVFRTFWVMIIGIFLICVYINWF